MNKKSKILKYCFGTFWFLLDPLLRCFLVRYFLVLFGPLRELFRFWTYCLLRLGGVLRDLSDSQDCCGETGTCPTVLGCGHYSASHTVLPLVRLPVFHSVSSASLSRCFYYIKKDAKLLFLLDFLEHFLLALYKKVCYNLYIK